jgi:exosortase C (VPDSG-CTERM-specific)
MNRRMLIYGLCLLAVVLVFHRTAWTLARLSLHSDLYSHIPIIPLISAYLVYLRRDTLPSASRPPVLLTVLFFGTAAASAVIAWTAGSTFEPHARLALGVLGMVLGVLGCTAVCWGADVLRAIALPAALLLFMIPMPESVEQMAAEGLQVASATAAHWLFNLAGTAVYRDGLVFRLPGLTIEVAEECSGIHSTLVLLISSIVAADVFLQTPWKKWLLAGLVIPLGILRNGFRIVSISLLTLTVDPGIIRGPLHRNGGPIYFILSLVILFLILMILRRTEKTVGGRKAAGGAT